jgi:predicted Rossmann fold nucleotide-binding protein DprA/Smf involved in DNA uptake
MEYNRDVLVVPGAITSPHHAGSNKLLREGAQAITCAEDILQALDIPVREGVSEKKFDDLLPDEQTVMHYLTEPRTLDEIAHATNTAIAHINVIISTLEIKGYIIARLGKIERTV